MKTVVELTREAGGFDSTPKFFERFAELVRADEREACAQLVDENANECNGTMGLVLRSNAQAIRAREKAK